MSPHVLISANDFSLTIEERKEERFFTNQIPESCFILHFSMCLSEASIVVLVTWKF